VPASIDDDAAVFVEPIAAACRLLVTQALRTLAADVTLLGRHGHKLEIGRSLGLTTAGAADHKAQFDVVVEVTGRADGMTRALELVRPRGTIVLKSTFHGEAPLASWPIVVNEVALVGSRCGPFRPAIEPLASGAVRTAPLGSASFVFEDWEAAFKRARSALKVILRRDADAGRRRRRPEDSVRDPLASDRPHESRTRSGLKPDAKG
jgi:alcohol dehydrogenase